MKSYTINFIRHGLTQANIDGTYAGITEFSLCKKGKENLLKLKSEYKYPEADVFYCSPLSRCKETCCLLYPEAKIEVIEELKEWDFGDWEAKTYKELMSDERYVKWIKKGRTGDVPNGESSEDFGKRICNCFEKIVYSMVSKGIQSANIFTHGGVIMTILSTYGIPRAEFLDWVVDNGCGYSVRIMPSLWMRDKVMEVYAKVPEGSNNKISGNFKKLIEEK